MIAESGLLIIRGQDWSTNTILHRCFDPYVKNLDYDRGAFLILSGITGKERQQSCILHLHSTASDAGPWRLWNLSLHKGKEWYREYIPVALYRLIAVLKLLPEYPPYEGCS